MILLPRWVELLVRIKVRPMAFLSKPLPKRNRFNSQPVCEIEVAGAFDAFVSLEDISPSLDWMEVLAASWGVPYCPTTDRAIPLATACAKSPALLNS